MILSQKIFVQTSQSIILYVTIKTDDKLFMYFLNIFVTSHQHILSAILSESLQRSLTVF